MGFFKGTGKNKGNPFNSLQDLIEKHGGIALEKQLIFEKVIGEYNWNVDTKKGEISFGEDWLFPFQIIGTFSHSSETWLWAWANIKSGLPQNLIEQSLILKKYGEDNGIDILKNEKFDVNKNDLHYIGIIASGMFNASGYYLANYGQGTMCATIKSGKIDELFDNDPIAVFTVFPKLVSLFEMNHQKALKHYLEAKGYEIKNENNEIVGVKGDNTVRAKFDKLFRMKSIKNK